MPKKSFKLKFIIFKSYKMTFKDSENSYATFIIFCILLGISLCSCIGHLILYIRERIMEREMRQLRNEGFFSY